MKKVPEPDPADQKSTDPTGSGSSSLDFRLTYKNYEGVDLVEDDGVGERGPPVLVLLVDLYNHQLMVLVLDAANRWLDGSSEHGAHIWSKSGISICSSHLVTSKASWNPTFFRKRPILLYTCATFSELPSCICTIHQFKIAVGVFSTRIRIFENPGSGSFIPFGRNRQQQMVAKYRCRIMPQITYQVYQVEPW